jgi:hypothetical protein
MMRHGQSIAFTLCLLLALPLLAAQAEESAPPFAGLPAEGSYAAALYIPALASVFQRYEYAFSADGPWLSAHSAIALDAFPGEERGYELRLRLAGVERVLRYVIDRRPPPAPRLEPASGFVGASVSPALSGQGAFFISIDGSPFTAWPGDMPRSFAAPLDATLTMSVAAYAVDAAGNASATSSARWLLSPPNYKPSSVPVSPPREESATAARLSTAAAHDFALRVEQDGPNALKVSFKLPEGAGALLAVNPGDPLAGAEAYALVEASNGQASARVPLSPGDAREYLLYPAYSDASGIRVAAAPGRIRPSFTDLAASSALNLSAEPRVEELGSIAILSWPPLDSRIYLSIDGAAFEPYSAPVILDRGAGKRSLSYYAESADGSRGGLLSLELPAVAPARAPLLSGAENGASYGKPVALSSDRELRYELSYGDDFPKAISAASPRLSPGGLRLEGKDGQVLRYRLRAAELDASGRTGDERFLEFSIDREAPPVPVLHSALASLAEADSIIEFAPSDGTIFVSVSRDGSALFTPYSAPIALGAEEGENGRRSYVVRAYAEDQFGNRSAEMKPSVVVVDRNSIYVADDGKAGARGTPDDPLLSLEEALARAKASGKGSINLRGVIRLSAPLDLSGDIALIGGFGPSWEDKPEAKARLDFSAVTPRPYYLRVSEAKLTLAGLELHARGSGSYDLIHGLGSELIVRDSSISISGGLDACVLRLERSSLDMSASTVESASALTSRIIDAGDSALYLRDSGIRVDSSVSFHEGLRMRGGSLDLRTVRVEANPSQAYVGMALHRVKASVQGLALFAKGGASSFRVASLDNAELDMSSAYMELSWKGEVAAYTLRNGSSLRLGQSTVLIKAGGISFLENDGSRAFIAASIIHADAGRAAFMKTNQPAVPDSLLANSLWGFGSYIDTSAGALLTKAGHQLAALEGYSSASYPNFIEEPGRTFSGREKGFYSLSRDSACVAAAPYLSWASAQDLHGRSLPLPEDGRRPNIGATQ